MNAHPHIFHIDQEHERELARRLNSTGDDARPVVVEIGGSRYRLVPEDDIRTTDDPAAGYDPERALAAVEAGIGAFKTMNVAAFMADMLEAREQDTPGHSF